MNLPSRYALLRRLPLPHGTRISVEERETERVWRQRIEDARTSKSSGEEIENLRQERNHELFCLAQDREVIYTKRLLRAARRLRVSIPTVHQAMPGMLTDDWDRSWDGVLYLSESGRERLRDSIHKERIARGQVRASWIALGTMLTGLIGALIGLVSILG